MNCEELDKRTNAYKECVKLKEAGVTNEEIVNAEVEDLTQEDLEEKHEKAYSSGLGDAVEKVTKATGIKKLVEMFTPEGEDCGCDKRKKALNKLRFRKTPLCLNVEEFKFLDELYQSNRGTIRPTESEKLIAIEERIFQKKYVDSLKCAPCIRQIYNDLKEVYQTYL